MKMTVLDDLDISQSERTAVEELKKRMKYDVDQNTYENSFMFWRFLKARDFNLNQAEDMLRKHLHWRKINEVDKIIQDYKEVEALEKYFPISRMCFDKEGSICRFVPLGTYDSKGLHRSAKYCDIEKSVIKQIELDEKLSREQYKNKNGKIPGYVYVYDMKNLSFALATDKKGIETLLKLGKLYQDNYPERLKYVFFINVSSYFAVPFSIFKTFLANNVLKKMHLYGSDGWQEKLLKMIDADQLPAFLGGTKTDPDGNPLCQTFIKHAIPFPECYYLKKYQKPLSKDPESKRLVLPRASFSEICIDVKQSGSIIEWEFETKSKDIAFGIFLKENEKVIELVPLLRMDTEDFSETGMYRCDKPGTYVLLFDNSYSWIRSKEIFYKASVVCPKDHESQLKV